MQEELNSQLILLLSPNVHRTPQLSSKWFQTEASAADGKTLSLLGSKDHTQLQKRRKSKMSAANEFQRGRRPSTFAEVFDAGFAVHYASEKSMSGDSLQIRRELSTHVSETGDNEESQVTRQDTCFEHNSELSDALPTKSSDAYDPNSFLLGQFLSTPIVAHWGEDSDAVPREVNMMKVIVQSIPQQRSVACVRPAVPVTPRSGQDLDAPERQVSRIDRTQALRSLSLQQCTTPEHEDSAKLTPSQSMSKLFAQESLTPVNEVSATFSEDIVSSQEYSTPVREISTLSVPSKSISKIYSAKTQESLAPVHEDSVISLPVQEISTISGPSKSFSMLISQESVLSSSKVSCLCPDCGTDLLRQRDTSHLKKLRKLPCSKCKTGGAEESNQLACQDCSKTFCRHCCAAPLRRSSSSLVISQGSSYDPTRRISQESTSIGRR